METVKMKEVEYLITDELGLTSGDKVDVNGEVVIFADKRIEEDGCHVFFFL